MGKRFVQEENLRFQQERAGQVEPLCHPTGKPAGESRPNLVQTHQPHDLCDALGGPIRPEPRSLRNKLEIPRDAPVQKEPRLLEAHTDGGVFSPVVKQKRKATAKKAGFATA